MTNREFFIERWMREYPAMLRVFRALPTDRLDYRPHPRSRSAGELVSLLVYELATGIELCDTGKINWNEPKKYGRLEEMIAEYERNHQILEEKLSKLDGATWEKKAPFLVNGQDVMGETFGGLCWIDLFDAVHHRGQLSVYLRPLGAKVPSIYGPSADDFGG